MLRKVIHRIFPAGTRRRGFLTEIASMFRTGGPADYAIPQKLRVNHRTLNTDQMHVLEQTLRSSYFRRSAPGYLETKRGQEDMKDHLIRRLQNARREIIPWLDSIRPLRTCRILEIGCGTGSDLIAFAEQGAKITSIDVDKEGIEVAKERCEIYGLSASIRVANATEVLDLFEKENFDFIIFFASLEHMTLPERLDAISRSWQLLKPANFWCLIETPNRLWFRDNHTSLLPFFHWLPDPLAFQYSRFSPRENFNDCYNSMTEERMQHFLRRGRGVSFHELVLAIGSFRDFEVVSYKNQFFKKSVQEIREDQSLSKRYIEILSELSPEIHPAFLQENLDLVLKKP